MKDYIRLLILFIMLFVFTAGYYCYVIYRLEEMSGKVGAVQGKLNKIDMLLHVDFEYPKELRGKE